MNKTQKKPFLSSRAQMFFGGAGVWLFLAAWSLSAFWQHIDSLKPTYQFAAKAGACGAEFVLLVFVFYHCFDVHIGVRKWSLLLGAALGIVVILHTGMLRGLDEATIVQDDTEKRLAETLMKVSKEQNETAARINAENAIGKGWRTQGRMDARLKAQQAENDKGVQDQIAKTITTRSEAIKSTSWLPRWYINGGMYAAMFICAIVAFTIVSLGRLNTEDVDTNYDGVPDNEQTALAVAGDPVWSLPDEEASMPVGKSRPSLWDRIRGKR